MNDIETIYCIEKDAEGKYTVLALHSDKTETIVKTGVETQEQAGEIVAYEYLKTAGDE